MKIIKDGKEIEICNFCKAEITEEIVNNGEVSYCHLCDDRVFCLDCEKIFKVIQMCFICGNDTCFEHIWACKICGNSICEDCSFDDNGDKICNDCMEE